MTARQLRCFVAMAVGRPDTNRVYDRYIAPTLRAANIFPVFMGRLEHNDDIDTRIIREIEACDFAIADLTYARPSVYFEAGYAQCRVPVVYTSRGDHFNPRSDDELGNFRVHFDLLMRNIIPWSSPSDAGFSKKLARRIRKVVAPMLRQRQSDERLRTEELQFQSISLSSRLEIVTRAATKALRRLGYRPLVVSDNVRPWVGRFPTSQTLNVGVVSVQASFTQKEIQTSISNLFAMLRSRFEFLDDDEGYNRERWQNRWPRHKLPNLVETKYVRKIVAQLVLCSLEKIPRGRLASALPSSTADESGKVLRLNTKVLGSNYKWLPASISVYIIDGIKSAVDAIRKTGKLKRR